MDQAEFDQLKATFPWSNRLLQSNQGGIIQVLDRFGNEVPIFTMVNFLGMITQKLVAKEPA